MNKVYLKDLDISTNEKLVQFLLEAPTVVVFSPEEEKLYKEYTLRTAQYAYPMFAKKGLFKLHRSENNLMYTGKREYMCNYNFESIAFEGTNITGTFVANKIYGLAIDYSIDSPV